MLERKRIAYEKIALSISPPVADRGNNMIMKMSNKRKCNSTTPSKFVFCDDTIFDRLYDKKQKKYKLENYGLFTSVITYRRHLLSIKRKRLFCTVETCGSSLRNADHLIDHMVNCHPNDFHVRVEISGGQDVGLLNKVSSELTSYLNGSKCSQIVRIERTYDFEEISKMKDAIINKII